MKVNIDIIDSYGFPLQIINPHKKVISVLKDSSNITFDYIETLKSLYQDMTDRTGNIIIFPDKTIIEHYKQIKSIYDSGNTIYVSLI